MNQTEKPGSSDRGRYLSQSQVSVGRKRTGTGKLRRCVIVTVLLCWDGLLLYMILRCLIVPVYGGLFVGIVSVYLGYQMHEEE